MRPTLRVRASCGLHSRSTRIHSDVADPLRPPRPSIPYVEKRGLPRLRATGRLRSPAEDVYHWVLLRTWPQFFALVGVAFLALNAIFALFYVLSPGAISGARAHSYEDAFFFSVQTFTTIGYGGMSPATRYGHWVVTLEALVGMTSVALTTGITFAKFSRPTAKILFSDKMVIAPRDGVPYLMFRMANWRDNQIVEAQLRMILLVTETTSEGDVLRRPLEIRLVRDKNAMFLMTWLALHRIDEESPFFGERAFEKLREDGAEIYVSLSGYDETIMQSIHARHAYSLDDVVANARFVDMMRIQPAGESALDYSRFHEVEAVQTNA